MAYPYNYPTQPPAIYRYPSGYAPPSSSYDIRQNQMAASMAYPYTYSAAPTGLHYASVPASQMPAPPPYAYYPQHVSGGMYGSMAPAGSSYYQQHGGEGVFNRWPGAPEAAPEEEEEKEEEARMEDRPHRRSHRTHRTHRSRQERGHRAGADVTEHTARFFHSHAGVPGSNEYITLRSMADDDDEELVAENENANDAAYVHDGGQAADSVQSRRLAVATAGREEVAYGSGSGSSGAPTTSELVREVVIHPGGRGRVVMHFDSDPPRLTSFRVSARQMRHEARAWPRVCHRGTDACDTTVGDETAVAAMYWLLRVLHEGEEVDVGAEVGDAGIGEHERREGQSGRALAARAAVTPIPRELPARVLAYVVLFGVQLGAMERQPATEQQQQIWNGRDQEAPSRLERPSRLRSQTESWLWAITNRRRERHVLDASVVEDWPFLLYASRTLGSPELIRRCLQMLDDFGRGQVDRS